PHTRANRVRARLQCGDGYLRARARLASNALNLDRAVVNLRHLVFQQPPQHVAVRAAEHDLRAAVGPADLHHIGADLVVHAVALAGLLLATRQDRLGAPKANRHHVAVIALDRPGNQVADAVLVLLILRLALRLTHALQDDLLGRLRRDAPEALRRVFHHNGIAELHVRIVLPRLLQADFRLPALDFLDDLFLYPDTRLTRPLVNVCLNALGRANIFVTAICRNERCLQRFNNDLFRQLASLRNLVKR